MITIISGSRNITNKKIVENAIKESGFNITKIVSGHARGVDLIGEEYAIENKIELIVCPANWEKEGKSAGQRRNRFMAEISEALIAIWDGESRGTKNMIEQAKRMKLKIFVYRTDIGGFSYHDRQTYFIGNQGDER